MSSKKAQTLSTHFIIVIIIAVILLVIIIAFATGALGSMFGTINIAQSAATSDDVSLFRIGCDNACFEAKELVKNEMQWQFGSKYCTDTIWVDDSGDKIKDSDEVKHCWDSPVYSTCEFTLEVPSGAVTKTLTCKVWAVAGNKLECRCRD